MKLLKNIRYLSDIKRIINEDISKIFYKNKEIQRNILISVSGGCDSVALLHLLMNIRNNFQNISFEIVHFNHQIRFESNEEEEFVTSLANMYNLPIHIFRLLESNKKKSGFQVYARNWRRKHLEELATLRGENCFIATAHHADDQIETYLQKLLRGVSLSNFQVMPLISGRYIRPLLRIHKHDLISYLNEQSFSWRDDSSNLSKDYTRNKVRLDVVPLLENIAGGKEALYRRISQLSEQSTQLENWINNEITKYHLENSQCINIIPNLEGRLLLNESYQNLSPLVQIELLKQIYMKLTLIENSLTYTMLTTLLNMTTPSLKPNIPSSISLDDKWEAIRINEYFIFQKRKDSQEEIIDKKILYDQNELINFEYSQDRIEKLEIEVLSQKDRIISPVDNELSQDILSNNLQTIIHNIPKGSKLIIRTKENGDTFIRSSSNSSSKKIKVVDLMRELKIPIHLRSNIPVIILNNEIIAIPPFVSQNYFQRNESNNENLLSVRINICKKV